MSPALKSSNRFGGSAGIGSFAYVVKSLSFAHASLNAGSFWSSAIGRVILSFRNAWRKT